AKDADLPTTKIDSFLQAHPPEETLRNLHTGSWIDQDFHIWIGSLEKNKAWDSLQRTRTFLEKSLQGSTPTPPDTQQAAWEEIYIAEGSDWFWWFGDDFHSDNDEEFDRLFRMHLSNVHLILGTEIPDSLKTPISIAHEVKPTIEPIGLIYPVIDGRVTDFYEWAEAGSFEARPSQGTMYRAEGFISGFYYGFDLTHFYFRIDSLLRDRNHLKGLEFSIQFLQPREWKVVFPVQFPLGEPPYFLLYDLRPGHPQKGQRFHSMAIGKIIEMSIPFSALQFQPKEKAAFFVGMQKGDLGIERYPPGGYLTFSVPDHEYE
ncbi:MAG: hypothetical protein NTY64_23520, partial [Deltaproteobacteria bacterium]|nr:hypothetical protein [Deltaproteobacteria bacterium]